MTVNIVDGWLVGTLPDDTGREWPVVQHRQNSARGPLQPGTPNLILHTTETDGYIEQLRFPSQWQCGEGKIGQHIKLGLAGDAVNTWDLWAQQIEMVGRSELGRWMPEEHTMGPVVALVAWLHQQELIKTGLKRPKLWPVAVDVPPGSGFPASTTYYRRLQDVWPNTPGVFGHLEIPDNAHWDPGGFDYPRFFARVQQAIEGEDMSTQDMREGSKRYREGLNLPANANADFTYGYNLEKRIDEAAKKPEPGVPGIHTHDERYALVKHPHVVPE